MKRLRRWLARRASLEGRRPSLEESLLRGTFARYALRRLGGFGVSRLAGGVAHVLEFTYALTLFTQRGVIASLAMLNAAAIIDAFVWGALEIPRTRLRTASKPAAHVQMTRLMTGAFYLSAAILAIAVALVAWHHRSTSYPDASALPTVLEAYGLVCGARLALDVVVRTYYSGVYAYQRVYRPVGVVVALEPIGLGAVLLLFPYLEEWAFPAGVAVTTLASRAMSVHYATRAYELRRLPRPRLRLTLLRDRASPPLPRGPLLRAGLANVSTRLGSTLVLAALIRVAIDDEALDPFTFLLHLVSPFIATAGGASRVFYHDFKRLSDEVSGALRRVFERRLLAVAVVVAALSWLCSAVTAVLFLGWKDLWVPVLSLLPLFLALSYLSILQLRDFAIGHFRRLAVSSAILCAALGFALYAGTGADAVTWNLALSACLLPAAAIFWWTGGPRWQGDESRLYGSLHGWAHALASEPGGVRVGFVKLARSAGARHASGLGRRLAVLVGARGGVVSLRAKERILWYERQPSRIGNRELYRASAGKITSAHAIDEASGASALSAAARAGAFAEPEAGERLPSAAELALAFRARFPGGVVLDLTARPPAEVRALTGRTCRALWRDAARDARFGRIQRQRSGFEVTSFRPGGEIRLLFITLRSGNDKERSAWRTYLTAVNWQALRAIPTIVDKAR